MVLVGCQEEGCLGCLHHICHGEYVISNYIDFGGGDQTICRNYVDELGSQRFYKKVVNITVAKKIKWEEYKE